MRACDVFLRRKESNDRYKALLKDIEDLHTVSAEPNNPLVVQSGRGRITMQRREKLSNEAKSTLETKYAPHYGADKIQETWVHFVTRGLSKKLDAASEPAAEPSRDDL